MLFEDVLDERKSPLLLFHDMFEESMCGLLLMEHVLEGGMHLLDNLFGTLFPCNLFEVVVEDVAEEPLVTRLLACKLLACLLQVLHQRMERSFLVKHHHFLLPKVLLEQMCDLLEGRLLLVLCDKVFDPM